MQKVITLIRETLFRLKLFLLGVRFYEVQKEAEEPVVYESEYSIGNLFQIKFSFRRMVCNDFVLRRGKLVAECYNSYVVVASFRGQVPDTLQRLNNRPFFFNGVYNDFGIEEHRTMELIADIYLDFLKGLIRKPAN